MSCITAEVAANNDVAKILLKKAVHQTDDCSLIATLTSSKLRNQKQLNLQMRKN